jgi:3-hydroxyisobutyrate dehydrogenase-like beta-hydroxyacid dehydrogenase
MTMDVAFVGLGAMGSAMAQNLIKAGHRVSVWNRSPEPTRALAEAGARVLPSPAEAMHGDAVMTMLADDNAVRAVYLDSGFLKRAKRGLVHVNHSTISVALAKELAAAHAEQGIAYVAAPVFGRPDVAAAAHLNIVVAGAEDAIARVQPLLDAVGQKSWPIGSEPFQANVVKLGGNLMIAAAIEAMAEAAVLGRAHGIDPGAMLDIYTSTLFACRAYASYAPAIAARQFEPAGFKLKLGLKDVRLALQAGDGANVPLPFASALRDGFIDAMAAGDAEKDWSALSDTALRRSGIKPT